MPCRMGFRCLGLLLLASLASAAEERSLYDRAREASVEIFVNDHLAGSGWFCDESGFILTAAHVVGSAGKRFEIRSAAAGRVEVNPVCVDFGHDAALLRAPERAEKYPALKFAGKIPEAGTAVFLIGAPIYRHDVMLTAAVARNTPTFEYLPAEKRYIEVLHIAGNAPPGMSGGPWFNAQGEVIALQSGIMRDGNSHIGIAFASPAAALKKLLENKRSTETATISAAVEELWQHQPEILKRFPPRTEGLVIRSPRGSGTAYRAGLREWDLIQSLDGKPMTLPDDFLRAIRAKKPGTEVELKVMGPDSNEVRTVKLKLDNMEAEWSAPVK